MNERPTGQRPSGFSEAEKTIDDGALPDEPAAEVNGRRSASDEAVQSKQTRRPSAFAKDPLPAPLPSRRSTQPNAWATEPSGRGTEIVAPTTHVAVPALPRRKRKRRFGTTSAFLLFVVVPTGLFAFYLYKFAPDQFTTEFRFSVSQGNPVLPGSSATMINPASSSGSALSSLASVLGSGSNTASPQNFMVTDYLTSRQAVDDLEKTINLKAMYTKPSIPWWERFDASESNEAFVKYFHTYIYANYDQVTGLAVASVRSYSANDTMLIATSLSDLSEKLVNDLNNRANNDAIRFAQTEVDKMESGLAKVDDQLLKYRKTEGTINPNNSAVPINVMLAQTLESTLSTLQTQIDAALHQGASRDAPVVKSLRMQIQSTQRQLNSVDGQITRNSDRSRALAKVVGNYEDLIFNQQYMQGMVVQVRQALVLAKANAAAQHLYIVPYVSPMKPESSDYPDRPLGVLLAALSFFGIWFGGLMIYKSIKDHAY